MEQDINYRWIRKQCTKAKGIEYVFYTVSIKDRYRYSSKNLKNCIEYVKNFAKQNNIPEDRILRNGKKRIVFQEL